MSKQILKIEIENGDFYKAYDRVVSMGKEVEMPQTVSDTIGKNDFYRLEHRLTHILYLKKLGMTYNEFLKNSESNEDNEFIKSLDKRCFYLFGDKERVN